ncbi:MAG: hypothetical protein H0V45_11490 [Actinobacteria bacterium]|nr:hypothetical protein [Actinomycetota bacterium]
MRLPSSARLAGLLAFACAAIALVLIAPGALARPGGGGDELEQVEAKLATCRKDLSDAREALQGTEELLALARKRPYVLVPVVGFAIVPMSVQQVTDAIILKYVTGEITRAKMVVLLRNLARRARETVASLKEAIDEAREGVEGVQKRCGALAEQRNRLRAGGGGGEAQESGLGNATGAATLSGRTLRITFTAADKVTTGVYSWTLGADCRSGSGTLRFTGPALRVGETHTSSVTKTAGG